MDQMVQCMSVFKKCRWPLKVLVHVLCVCMNNAHLNYLQITSTNRRKCSITDFTKSVIDELLTKYTTTKTTTINSNTITTCTHTPVTYGKSDVSKSKSEGTGAWHSLQESQRNTRGECRVCLRSKARRKVSMKCLECNVWLHPRTESSGYRCWEIWHQEQRSS